METYSKWKNYRLQIFTIRTFNLRLQDKIYNYRLVAAYKSLRTNLPYLFISKKYKNITAPNTTNFLDGGVFSPMKMLIKIHRGLNKSLKLKIVDDYLVNYKKKE